MSIPDCPIAFSTSEKSCAQASIGLHEKQITLVHDMQLFYYIAILYAFYFVEYLGIFGQSFSGVEDICKKKKLIYYIDI
jgi:hypothetical protein